MSDIVERLRAEGENALRRHLSLGMHNLCSEAADEIKRLRAALRIIAGHDQRIAHLSNMDIARAALSGKGES